MNDHIGEAVKMLDEVADEIAMDGRDVHVIAIIQRDGQAHIDVRATPAECIDTQTAIRILDAVRAALAESMIPERWKH